MSETGDSGLAMKLLKMVQAHADAAWQVVWNKRTGKIVTASIDNTVKIFNDQATLLQTVQTGHALGIVSLDAGLFAATCSLDSQIKIWDTMWSCVRTVDLGPVEAWRVCITDKQVIACGSHAGTIHIVPPSGPSLLLETRAGFVQGLCWAGNVIACGTEQGAVFCFDATTAKMLFSATPHAGPVRCVAVSPDGKLLISGSDDFKICVFDLVHQTLLATLQAHNSWVLDVQFSQDGLKFASCGADKKVRIWSAVTRTLLHVFDDHTDQVWSISWSPDSCRLASVGDDMMLAIYDVEC